MPVLELTTTGRKSGQPRPTLLTSPVQEGDTENDCVRHTRKLVEPVRRDYFADLTGQWMLVAYAERDPAPTDMERLLQSWPFREQGGPQ